MDAVAIAIIKACIQYFLHTSMKTRVCINGCTVKTVYGAEMGDYHEVMANNCEQLFLSSVWKPKSGDPYAFLRNTDLKSWKWYNHVWKPGVVLAKKKKKRCQKVEGAFVWGGDS